MAECIGRTGRVYGNLVLGRVEDDLNLYAYVYNDPLDKTDPTGKFFGLDDLAGFVVGGIIGAGLEEARSGSHSLGDLAGAFVAGGIVGVGAVNAPETGGASLFLTAAAVGGVAAGSGNVVKQEIDLHTGEQKGGFDTKAALINTGVGAVVGAATAGLPAAKIPGLTAGSNSAQAVAKSAATKIENGTANSVSGSTAIKAAIGSQTADAYKTTAAAAADAAKVKACTAAGNEHC